MGVLEQIATRRGALAGRGRKEFSEPPFWASDPLRLPFLAVSAITPDREPIENNFDGYAWGGFKSDSIVFSTIAYRMRVFSQARFQWLEYRNGQPGNLFGSPELAILEKPWPAGTTGGLLARGELDASLAGNYYATTADDRGRLGRAARGPGRFISRMRPDWTTLIVDAPSGDLFGLDARVVGMMYEPLLASGGVKRERTILLPSEVCHYAPIPDPVARFRGMSWLTPILKEIQADKAATQHKLKFFENGATPNLAIKFDKDTDGDAFDEFVEKFREAHQGVDKAYKTLFLAGGADITPLSVDLRQLDFKATQGAGETRIASAGGVHPVLLGLSEGLQGSSLNAGNYNSAKRGFVDATARSFWQGFAASVQVLVDPPMIPGTSRPNLGAQLWYDDRNIPYLRQDARDDADIQQVQAAAIRQLIDAGFRPDAAVDAVVSGDLARLAGSHSGLFSVQLQPIGAGQAADQTAAGATPSPNGNGRAAMPARN